MKLLESTATLGDVIDVVNEFYGEFVARCILENHVFCNQMDVNDGETNTKNAGKVL